MSSTNDQALREQLKRLLGWEDAHVGLQTAVKGLSPELRSMVPEGMPHSAWQILEHLRIAQHDIHDFCVKPGYKEMRWPEDYWPPSPAPPNARSWDQSIAAFETGLEAMQRLAMDPAIDLFARIPHGSGQTYLREILLVADHNAYHVGQLVLLRRRLGAWPP